MSRVRPLNGAGRRNRAAGEGNPLWVAAGPRASILEATGKDLRQPSPTHRAADPVERRAAPSCGYRRSPLRGGSARDVALARSRGAREPRGTQSGPRRHLRHRFAIVCLTGLQSQRNCGNPRRIRRPRTRSRFRRKPATFARGELAAENRGVPGSSPGLAIRERPAKRWIWRESPRST
jgi:hypothetical protein